MSIHRTLKNLLIILVSVAFFLLFQFLLLFLKKKLKDLHIYFSSSNINVLSVIVQSLNQLRNRSPLWSFFFFSFFFGPQGYGFHPIKNLRNCDQDLVAPFNSNVHNKTLCESRVMWIFRFVTYLSIVFHNYLCIIIHFQPSIITNVSILTDPAYIVPPSCHCGILALRSRDF